MHNRREFIKKTGIFIGGVGLAPQSIFSIGKPKQQLGICLVGLGNYSTRILAPALQLAQHCKLTGIVTGSPEKIPVWQKKYQVPDANVYNYENMGEIANNPDIDVIYIVLPTGLHAQYAIKAANAGKHVWCEKPMAKTAADCQAIINACERNKVKLSIGYRMQHEPNTQRVMEWAKTKPFGDIRKVRAEVGFKIVNPPNNWRMDAELGGGLIYDVGVYSINAMRYTTGKEPLAVKGHHENTRPEIYKEVAETTIFELDFPSGIQALGKTTAAESTNVLRAECEKGWYELSPFQSYNGVQGKTSDGTKLEAFTGNQQALQMDNDAMAILQDKPVLVPGEDGMRDIAIIEAINESARTGKTVKLN